MDLPSSKNEAYEDGVLKRTEGYNKYFNPFNQNKKHKYYLEWLKGWSLQNNLMIN